MSTKVKKLPTIANEVEELNETQHECIRMMIAGFRQTAIAEALEIAPETISRWKQQPEFLAMLNLARADAYEAVIARLEGASMAAISVLEELLEARDAGVKLNAAKALLSGVRLLRQPVGPTNVEAIRLVLKSEGPSELDKLLAEMSHG